MNFSVWIYSVAPPVEMLYPFKQFADIVIYLKVCFDLKYFPLFTYKMWQFFLYSEAGENVALYIQTEHVNKYVNKCLTSKGKEKKINKS